MKRVIYVLLALSALAVALSVFLALPRSLSLRSAEEMLSSIFFVESTTTAKLRSSYDTGKRLRVLIVPGHDNENWGTEFRGLREADLTATVGEKLSFFLSSDPHFEPILVRTKTGYAPEFAEYFIRENAAVKAFVANKKKVMKDLLKSGMLEREEGVIHNNASSDVAYRLYGVNKWANEHDADIVLHLHFNDYPRRAKTKAGRYTGFAIYVPDKQYSNARPSRELAASLALRFAQVSAPSTHPQEGAIVSDQELIALGSYNTLDAASVLIEYGYIYEPRFGAAKRAEALQEFARLTHEGLRDFFAN